ncbi:hypothetical protein [Glutamicibacter ardleyensis]|uniref:hypothetical protein n=1 Tax=Glutamicibacter ardleyensis TaxID=225894 RepID=UPI003FD6A822
MNIFHYLTQDRILFYVFMLVACFISWWLHRVIGSARARGIVVTCGQHVLHLLLSAVAAYSVLSALIGRPIGFKDAPQAFHVDVKDPFAVFRQAFDFMHEYHPQTILVDEGMGGISWLFTVDTYLLLIFFAMTLVFFVWVTPLTVFYLISSLWFTMGSLLGHVFTKSCGCHRNKVETAAQATPTRL